MNTLPVWITGASSGIGAAMAREWATREVPVILSGRDEDRLAAVAQELSSDTLILPFDVTDARAMHTATAQATDWRGGIGTFVANAGISQRSLALESDYAVYETILKVDLLAPIAMTQALLPSMAAQRHGRLVFISSVAGKVGVPLRTAYCAAKHGLIGYADALRAEIAGQGLSVHTVVPGSVATDVSRNALDKSGQRRGVSDSVIDNGIPPQEAAREIVEGVEGGEREIIVARGIERELAEMRRTPDALFDQIAAMAAKGIERQLAPEKADG